MLAQITTRQFLLQKNQTFFLLLQTTQANLLTNLSSYPLKPNLGAMGRQTRNSRNTPDTKHGPLTRQTRNSQQSNTTTIPSSRSTVAMVNKTSVKPAANETGQHRPSGGRHLQPPTGNDAKLKHKVKEKR